MFVFSVRGGGGRGEGGVRSCNLFYPIGANAFFFPPIRSKTNANCDFHFPALDAGCTFLLRSLIGSLCYLCLL